MKLKHLSSKGDVYDGSLRKLMQFFRAFCNEIPDALQYAFLKLDTLKCRILVRIVITILVPNLFWQKNYVFLVVFLLSKYLRITYYSLNGWFNIYFFNLKVKQLFSIYFSHTLIHVCYAMKKRFFTPCRRLNYRILDKRVLNNQTNDLAYNWSKSINGSELGCLIFLLYSQFIHILMYFVLKLFIVFQPNGPYSVCITETTLCFIDFFVYTIGLWRRHKNHRGLAQTFSLCRVCQTLESNCTLEY